MPDAAKECPQCHLLNPPNALRCDCGYDFALPAKQQAAKGRPFRPQAERSSLQAHSRSGSRQIRCLSGRGGAHICNRICG